MHSRLLLSILLAASCFPLQGQSETEARPKWQVRPSVGLEIPLTTLFEGAITDDLIEYSDQPSTYLQVIAVTYFFHEHWGVEFNYQGISSSRTAGNVDRFSAKIQTDYQDQYFVTPSTGGASSANGVLSGTTSRGLLGIVYRKDLGKFFLHPKFAIGVTAFDANWGAAALKERNSNTLADVAYWPDNKKVVKDFFTLATSISAGYTFTKRIHLNVEVMTSYFPLNITYTKTTTNLYDGSSSSETIDYRKNLFTLSLGVGLIIVIK